jgi:hypothetical protein
MTEEQINYMVQRFLGWKLPANFNPDDGISFDPIMNKGHSFESRRVPVGTNLFDPEQADAMVRYMVDGMASVSPTPDAAIAPSQERLLGPHEWGYRDPTDGQFIADDAPFQMGERLAAYKRLEEAARRQSPFLHRPSCAFELTRCENTETLPCDCFLKPVTDALAALDEAENGIVK